MDPHIFARSLRDSLGSRALTVAQRQRDSAQGDARAVWDAIVALLADVDSAPFS